MKKHQGFTLIEILLVLVLLSITAVAVIGSIPTNSKDEAKHYGQSLYQRLRLLNEEALLSGKDFGIRVDDRKDSYTLLILTADGWVESNVGKIPQTTELDGSGVALDLTLGGGAWADDGRLFESGSLFDDDRFADEDRFADSDEKPQAKPPQLFIFSSGEMTPFTLSFYPQQEDAEQDGWRVVVKDTGVIRLLEPGEQDDEN